MTQERATVEQDALRERDSMGMAMLAAWLNVTVDQIPPENTAHLNASTMEAWDRVGKAALAAAGVDDLKARVDRLEGVTAAIDLIRNFQWRDGDEKSAAVAMRHIARTAAGDARAALEVEGKGEG